MQRYPTTMRFFQQKKLVEKEISDLPSDKKNLMMLICQQLVQATGEEYLYEQTDITVKCQEQDFKARGKIPVQMGFKEVEKAFKQLCVKAEPVEGKEKENFRFLLGMTKE